MMKFVCNSTESTNVIVAPCVPTLQMMSKMHIPSVPFRNDYRFHFLRSNFNYICIKIYKYLRYKINIIR
jgi:hypothetical protein